MALTRLCEICQVPKRECWCDTAEPPPTWDVPPYECRTCQDTGRVCSRHPSRPWGLLCCEGAPGSGPGKDGEVLCEHGACHCWATHPERRTAGVPCPDCHPLAVAEGKGS